MYLYRNGSVTASFRFMFVQKIATHRESLEKPRKYDPQALQKPFISIQSFVIARCKTAAHHELPACRQRMI
jgi:hypothetical protein